VLGEDEARAGVVSVKWLRGDPSAAGDARQERIAMGELAGLLLGELANPNIAGAN
jgi:hypothetical protein